jgi:hypothetical protein
VADLPLAPGVPVLDTRCGEATAHVPLDTLRVRQRQHFVQVFVNIATDSALARNVWDQLAPTGRSSARRDVQAPVRAQTAQVAVRGVRLRLGPDPKLEPERADILGDAVEPVRQFLRAR